MKDIFAIAQKIISEMKTGNTPKRARKQGFFRCECTKLHTYSLISYATKCSCGKRLMEYI